MEIIKKYFPSISQEQITRFEKLQPLYEEWNEKINVVSRKDIENLMVNHVLHSLAIAKVIWFKAGTKILDVGTGGGFPGIPLAVLFPEVNFHLVDSIGKKIKVVNEVKDELGLQNVLAEQQRVEMLQDKYDFVITRGVTNLAELLKWNKKNISKTSFNEFPNGLLALKGGASLIEEIGQINTHVKTWLISDFFKEDFFKEKKVVYVKN